MIKLPTLALLLASVGLAAAVAAPGAASTSASTAPVGALDLDVPGGLSGLSLPLLRAEILRGRIAAQAASGVTFDERVGAVAPRLVAGQPYYLEIVRGGPVGERFDVDTAATLAAPDGAIVLRLNAASHSTRPSLAGLELAGAYAVLRPHLTLASLAGMVTPALVGDAEATLADAVQWFEEDGFVRYHLAADGETWRRSGGSGADERDRVIAPDVSVVLELNSGPRQLIHLGHVRTTPFRKNLRAGYQAFATGFPVDVTPAAAGAGAATGSWVGANDAGEADTVEVFEPGLSGFRRFYLRADGLTWRRLGRLDNYAAAPVLRLDRAMILRRNAPDGTYTINPPFSL